MASVAVSVPDLRPEDFPEDGATWPCVERARELLARHGLEPAEYPSSGAGGRELEAAVAAGRFVGILELTLTELGDEVTGGLFSAGPDRLTAAALHAVPQVIVPGALDRVHRARNPADPQSLSNRRVTLSKTGTVLVRTTPEENDRLGREIALKASASRGPTAVLLPSRGLSALDRDGQAFWWPEADRALFQSIRNWISPDVVLDELDLHVNDPRFARVVVERLVGFLGHAR